LSKDRSLLLFVYFAAKRASGCDFLCDTLGLYYFAFIFYRFFFLDISVTIDDILQRSQRLQFTTCQSILST
jgi:hypothetical protein